jgi:hypothetical protein
MSRLQTLSSYFLTNLMGGFRDTPPPQLIAALQDAERKANELGLFHNTETQA